jgi:hypothetical protein
VKFLRHLLAVCAVLVVICAGALLIGHGTHPATFSPNNAQHPQRLNIPGPFNGDPKRAFEFRHFDSGSAGLNWSSVIQTVILGGAIAALVVGIDLAARGRRQRARTTRRARRDPASVV